MYLRIFLFSCVGIIEVNIIFNYKEQMILENGRRYIIGQYVYSLLLMNCIDDFYVIFK